MVLALSSANHDGGGENKDSHPNVIIESFENHQGVACLGYDLLRSLTRC
jgi:hypothetical protein